jgi:hypothetical protein
LALRLSEGLGVTAEGLRNDLSTRTGEASSSQVPERLGVVAWRPRTGSWRWRRACCSKSYSHRPVRFQHQAEWILELSTRQTAPMTGLASVDQMSLRIRFCRTSQSEIHPRPVVGEPMATSGSDTANRRSPMESCSGSSWVGHYGEIRSGPRLRLRA